MGSCQSATLEACQKEDSELKRPCPMKELTPVLAPSTAIGKPGQLSASLPASPTLRQSPLGGHIAADERVDSVQLKVLNAVARKLNEGTKNCVTARVLCDNASNMDFDKSIDATAVHF